MSSEEQISYADAMTELNRILAEIERDDVDVDTLSTKVRRAMELIELCRGRISGTMAEVERIVAPVNDGPDPSAAGDQEPDS